jgi:hypothetical protein
VGVWHFGPSHKKLTGAAAFLVSGSGECKDLEADLDFWGIPDESRPEKPTEYGVLPENWDAVTLFLALQTQWRITPSGTRSGLVYSSIRTVSNLRGVKLTPELFADIQLMEVTLINTEREHGNWKI